MAAIVWKWQDKEVHSPLAKALIAIWLLVYFTVMLIWLFVFAVLAVVLIPVWVPIDFVLKRFGKRGFAYREDTTYSLKFNLGAFRE